MSFEGVTVDYEDVGLLGGVERSDEGVYAAGSGGVTGGGDDGFHVGHARHGVRLYVGLVVAHRVVGPRGVGACCHYHTGISHAREMVHSRIGGLACGV